MYIDEKYGDYKGSIDITLGALRNHSGLDDIVLGLANLMTKLRDINVNSFMENACPTNHTAQLMKKYPNDSTSRDFEEAVAHEFILFLMGKDGTYFDILVREEEQKKARASERSRKANETRQANRASRLAITPTETSGEECASETSTRSAANGSA